MIAAAISCIAGPVWCQNYFTGQMSIPGQSSGQTWDMPHPLLLGSAPSPTPDDLCVSGSTQRHCYVDPTTKERRRFIPDPDLPGHYRELRPGDDKIIENMLRAQKLTRQSFGPGN